MGKKKEMSVKTGSKLGEFLALEYNYGRLFGRITQTEMGAGYRVLPRGMRRRWARRYKMGRVPIIQSLVGLEVGIAELENELERRERARSENN